MDHKHIPETAQLRVRLDSPPSPRLGSASKCVDEVQDALNTLLADLFTLYFKAKNFHWHLSGPHFRDYHLLLDGHADQIFSITDEVAERVRKIGGTTIRSVGHIVRLQ